MSTISSEPQTPLWCDFEPMIDVFDEGDAFSIVLEIPGVSADSISIVQSGSEVIVTGIRALQLDLGFHPHIEGDYGRFHRRIHLPGVVQAAGRTVNYTDGLLTIHLPKCPLLASA